MIPVRLAFEAFGPYVERQEVDFAPLRDAGLFLIYGETGAGKTAILDAMTYALFGKSSGDNRGELVSMRSDFAPEDREMQVEFVFSVHDRTYKFTRGVAVHTKRNGTQEHRVSQNAFYMDEQGQFAPFFENPKIKDVRLKAEELLGLTYEQFRQVILLPQGQFEKLLVATSEEKEAILSTLFNAEEWQRVTDALGDMASQKKQEKEDLERGIENLLIQNGCETEEELQAALQSCKQKIEALRVKNAGAVKHEEAARAKLAVAQEAVRMYDALEQAQAEQQVLLVQRTEIKRAEEALKRAADVQKVQPLRKNAALLDAAVKKREEEAAKAKNTSVITMRQAQEAAAQLHGHLAWLAEENMRLEELQTEQARAIGPAQKEHEAVFAAYIGGMAHSLAQGLEDNVPCPVCGSMEHPHLAEPQENTVAEKDVKAAETVLERARKAHIRTETELSVVQREMEECGVWAHRLEKPAEIYAKQADKAALLVKLNDAEQNMKVAEAMEQAACKAVDEAEQLFDEAMGEYRKACIGLGFENDEQVRESSMDEAHMAEMQSNITEYNTKLKALEQRVLQLQSNIKEQKPDLNAATQEAQAALTTLREGETAQAQAQAQMEMLEKAMQTMTVQNEKLVLARNAFSELDAFSKLLRGNNGVGIKRYVLGVMLSAVTGEANKLLRQVHGGRYTLYRSSGRTGRTRNVGLDLEVFDSHTGERRSVSGLSGGEKFLVSLALSLGLSAVVQAQSGGIRIDAMFIDEGFGTLDSSSVEDALGLLAGIRGSSRLVGIISHVQMLRENIEASIQVVKTNRGSTIKMNV